MIKSAVCSNKAINVGAYEQIETQLRPNITAYRNTAINSVGLEKQRHKDRKFSSLHFLNFLHRPSKGENQLRKILEKLSTVNHLSHTDAISLTRK